jgi:hypothetical protein
VNLLDRIRARFRRPDVPMRRWMAEELASEKAALEAYNEKDQATLNVQMRVVEYIAQRYLRKDDQRTEASCQRFLAVTRARLEAAERGEPLVTRAPVVRVPIPPDPVFEAWLAERSRSVKTPLR